MYTDQALDREQDRFSKVLQDIEKIKLSNENTSIIIQFDDLLKTQFDFDCAKLLSDANFPLLNFLYDVKKFTLKQLESIAEVLFQKAVEFTKLNDKENINLHNKYALEIFLFIKEKNTQEDQSELLINRITQIQQTIN